MKIEYTDHNGHKFTSESLLPCPFCGSKAELFFIGNISSKVIKAVAVCGNVDCRCEIVNATRTKDSEKVANYTINAWNKRPK